MGKGAVRDQRQMLEREHQASLTSKVKWKRAACWAQGTRTGRGSLTNDLPDPPPQGNRCLQKCRHKEQEEVMSCHQAVKKVGCFVFFVFCGGGVRGEGQAQTQGGKEKKSDA